MQSKENTLKVLKILQKHYGNLDFFLNHKNVFEFLIAVILSAQTTDITVNKITPALFEKFPTAAKMKKAKLSEIEKLIRQVNYHHTKAKHLIETSRMIDEEFHNQVPKTMEELIALPGVGRKVANVILSDYYKIPLGYVVDTHVKRVSYRIGWTKNTDPKKIEKDMMERLPQKYWVESPKQLILIGRQFCFAKKPDCLNCPLNKICEKNGVKIIKQGVLINNIASPSVLIAID